ncbi:unnamed protein product, partial [Brachionus calyciflorus]
RDGVSSLTIQRCFRKAGFNGDFLFSYLDSENEENKDIAELSKFQKKLDFEKFAYVSIDSNLEARGSLSDLDIFDSITVTEDNAEADSDIEEISKSEKTAISSKDTIDRINNLKYFFMNKKEDFSNIVDFYYRLKYEPRQTSFLGY